MTDEEELKETPDTEVTVEPSLEEEIETDPEKEKIAEEECKKTKKFGWLKELLVYLVIIILCVTFVPKYVIQRTQVDGHSMETTLHDEENLIVEKVTYHFKNPDRFDIITFYPKGRNADEYYIKRVIGLPGETIQIKGNTIYINGKVLKEHYGLEPMVSGGIAEKPIKLEDVRAVLARKSAEGHTTKVQELLRKHGADKLSRIDPAHYAALIAEAEVF